VIAPNILRKDGKEMNFEAENVIFSQMIGHCERIIAHCDKMFLCAAVSNEGILSKEFFTPVTIELMQNDQSAEKISLMACEEGPENVISDMGVQEEERKGEEEGEGSGMERQKEKAPRKPTSQRPCVIVPSCLEYSGLEK
jgi:hypothetical protein